MLSPHNALCMDARMLDVAATGVASYAATLRTMLPGLAARPMLLTAGGEPRSRLARLAAAARPGARRATLACALPDMEALAARDLFREAQVHFNLYGRLLTVRGLPPGGIMHWTYPVPLHMAGAINVYTVHDAIPLTRPDLTPIAPKRHRRLLDRIVAVADRIVTVSEAARTDLLATLGCAPGKIENCSQAVPLRAAGPPPEGLPSRGYLLICGSVEPRKNVARALEAYAASGVGLPLVIAGPDGWQAGPLRRRLEATGNVVRLGWQPREGMDALIGHARALVMPSLAEGFGLPVIEAMGRGTPVLTSAGGALEEVAGGAALLADPEDVAAIAAGIRAIARDDALAARLAAAGRARAEAFAPAAVTARLARLYGDLVATRAPISYRPRQVSSGDRH